MANGYPISALVGRKKYMKLMDEVFVSEHFQEFLLQPNSNNKKNKKNECNKIRSTW